MSESDERSTETLSRAGPVRVLLVEHDPVDLGLIKRALRGAAFDVETDPVQTREEVAERLRTAPYDVVLAAYALPGGTGMDLLELLRAEGHDVPLILLTNGLGDELAVDCVKRGASDYILKDGLEGLPSALERALSERSGQRSRARIERLLQVTDTALYALDPAGPPFEHLWMSEGVHRLLGVAETEVLSCTWWLSRVHPEDRDRVRTEKAIFGEGHTLRTEYRFLHADGEYRWLRDELTMVRSPDGHLQELLGVLMDVTDRYQADEDHQGAAERLRGLFESSSDGIVFASRDGTLLEVNTTFCAMTGLSRGEMLSGIRYQDVISPELEGREEGAAWRVLETGRPEMYEAECVRKDGTRMPVAVKVWLVEGSRGEPVGLAASIRNVTERNLGARALQRAQSVLENTTDLVGMADATGRVISLNPAGRDLIGVPADKDVAGTFVSDYFGRDVADHVATVQIPTAIREGTWSGEMQLLARDGVEIPVSCVVSAHHSPSGEVDFISIIARDISDIRSVQVELEERQQRLLQAQRVARVGFLDFDVERNTVEWSDEVYRIYGVDPGQDTTDISFATGLLHPDDRERALETLDRAVQGLDFEAIDHRVVRPDGEVVWVHADMELIRGPDGAPARLIGTVLDITERVAVDSDLRLFRSLIDHSTDAIQVIDPETGRFLDVNNTGCEVLGYTRAEMLELCVHDVDPLVSPKGFAQAMESFDGSDTVTVRSIHERKDGSTFPVEINFTLVQLDRAYVVAVSRDISKRVEDEAERALLGAAVQQATDAVVATDPMGAIQYVNPAFESITGYTRAEVMGENLRILKSGAQDAAFYEAMWNTITRGDTWRGEMVNLAKDGTLLQMRQTIFPVRGPDGRPISYVAIGQDTSEQRALEGQLRQATKLEAVGRLAGGVAHDINNVLAVISITTELLIDDLEPEDVRRDDVLEIRDAANRAATLTRQLLAFSRQQVLSPRVCDLNAVVSGIDTMVRRLIGEDIDVSVALDPALGAVTADPGQVEQLLMNLAVNARDAMPKGGKLTIETANVDLDEVYSTTHADAPSGSFALLAVTDTGTGMDEEIQTRAFEPFFTTKDVGEGTGLGLSTVYGIAKQSGGHVSIYSEVGLGTTIKVYLPHADASIAEDMPATEGSAMSFDSVAILLVEDEDAVRALVARVLESHGMRVLSAPHGDEALRVAIAHEGTIDLLITDVIMPGMSGQELAAQLGALRRDLKTLFVSGYPGQAIAHQGVLEKGVAFLPKPFTPEVLLRKVHEVLSE